MPSEKPLAKRRRLAAARVREARERLTSTTGTRVAFDYELLRQFAENRLSASLVILLLVGTVGFLSSLWTGAVVAGAWTASVLVIHAVIVTKCRQFLSEPPDNRNLKRWRLRFIVLDLFYGLAWMYNLVHPVGQDEGSSTFMLFVMLLVVAVSSMLASSLPIAVFAATVPVTFAVALHFALQGDLHNYILGIMAIAAQGYFTLLAHRLYSAGLATLVARAEKDALIGELEQAKAVSDEARRRAEGANIAKSQFLAQMSHELRTPLNAILGFSEVMKNEVFGAHEVAAYKDYSNDIHNSGQHLLNLINEILDLSRIEAGRYELNEEAVSLTMVVEDCHHLLTLRAKNRGVTIHEVFEPELPRLWADERALRQICLNLLSNAIKFTPSGGEVWLKVGWTASGGQYLSVKDTGPGIPEEEISVVLSKFGQGSNAIKSAEHGPRPADREESRRPARWNIHAQIEGPHRHRTDRDPAARARDGGAAAARRTRALDRSGRRTGGSARPGGVTAVDAFAVATTTRLRLDARPIAFPVCRPILMKAR
jgi:two-component system cell cycle sensor histidine kinase PleC